jgi:hypothetical protein
MRIWQLVLVNSELASFSIIGRLSLIVDTGASSDIIPVD